MISLKKNNSPSYLLRRWAPGSASGSLSLPPPPRRVKEGVGRKLKNLSPLTKRYFSLSPTTCGISLYIEGFTAGFPPKPFRKDRINSRRFAARFSSSSFRSRAMRSSWARSSSAVRGTKGSASWASICLICRGVRTLLTTTRSCPALTPFSPVNSEVQGTGHFKWCQVSPNRAAYTTAYVTPNCAAAVLWDTSNEFRSQITSLSRNFGRRPIGFGAFGISGLRTVSKNIIQIVYESARCGPMSHGNEKLTLPPSP